MSYPKSYPHMARTYGFNHLELNDISDEKLRIMLIEAFRRITDLEDKLNDRRTD